MMGEPITRQVEALELWPIGGVTLLHEMRGEMFCFVDDRPVRRRVWERLLERGDLCLDSNPWGGWPNSRVLGITAQGLLRARRDPDGFPYPSWKAYAESLEGWEPLPFENVEGEEGIK